jgi:hypothetical protein
MKPSSLLLIFCLTPFLARCQVSPHVITFFVRPLPEVPTPAIQEALERQQKAKGAAKQVPNTLLSIPFAHAGLYASYAGTLIHSDSDGQILFERKSPEPKLTVLVTNSIKPIPVNPLNQKTLYGFMIGPKEPAQQYLFERLQDPETELYEWHVKAIPVDRNARIPYDTIVIYANPHDIIVPLGPSATKVSENFVLPDFYIAQGYNSSSNAIRFLKIRHYFAPVSFEYTYLPFEFQKKISV